MSFMRLIPVWMTVDEFCKALLSVQAGEDTVQNRIDAVIDRNRWKLASAEERQDRMKKCGREEFDFKMEQERNIKKPRVHWDA